MDRILRSIMLFMSVGVIACTENVKQEIPHFYGMYSPSNIETLKDIDAFDYGTFLSLREDGRLSMPFGLRSLNPDFNAKGKVLVSGSEYRLLAEIQDSSLNGEWLFSNIVFDTAFGGKIYFKKFTLSNEYYRANYDLIYLMDE